MKKKSKSEKRPGKTPIYAEVSRQVATNFKTLAEKTRRQFRGELEYAMLHWLSLDDVERANATVKIDCKTSE